MITIIACLACFIFGGCTGFLISGLCLAASDKESPYLDNTDTQFGR
jgi:hypothetical protein